MRAGQAGAKYSMRASQTGSKYSMSADQRTPNTTTCARRAGPKYYMRAGQTHSTASLAARARSARYARGIRCTHGDAAEPADQRRDAPEVATGDEARRKHTATRPRTRGSISPLPPC